MRTFRDSRFGRNFIISTATKFFHLFIFFKYRDASSRGFYNSSTAFVPGGIAEIIHRGEHVKFIYLLVYLAKEPLHLYTCILNK